MRIVQDILFGVTGQSFYFDCPEGRPSSVTSAKVYRWDSEDDTVELTLSASVETNPSTTFDASSGYGQTDPRVLYLTATTGIEVGRTYLATTADGAREWVEVVEIDSGNAITAKHPLHNAFASADTFQTTRISATVDSSWVAEEENIRTSAGPNPAYRCRWVYVVGGVTYVSDSYANLVRYAGKHGVRPQDIEQLAPGWLDRLPVDHRQDQGRRLIDNAYQAVKTHLHTVWTDDAMVGNAEIIDELTRYQCLEQAELARILSGGGSSDAYQAARTAFQSRFDQLARITNKLPIRDKSGAATHRTGVGLTRR